MADGEGAREGQERVGRVYEEWKGLLACPYHIHHSLLMFWTKSGLQLNIIRIFYKDLSFSSTTIKHTVCHILYVFCY